MEKSCEECKKNSSWMKNREACVKCANGELDAWEPMEQFREQVKNTTR